MQGESRMNVRNGIEGLSQILPAQSATAAKSSTTSQSGRVGEDKANVSALATHVAQSAATSDVRMDKVTSIQNALQAGTYHVPASDVAQKIIASMLSNEE
jgi:negative regulator of flagellin synthesis FlgM